MTPEKKGEFFIFLETSLWAAFPIVTVLSYAVLPSLVSFAWSVLFSAILFGGMVVYRKTWREMANPVLWKYIFFITLFVGILFYGLYFVGLESTTPGNAAIIVLFQVFTSFFLFNLFRDELFSLEHKVGAFCMVIGALIVLAPNFSGVNVGDFLILAATFIVPFGNLYSKKAREIASSETIMFLRTVCSAPVIFLLAYFIGSRATTADIIMVLPLLLINVVLLLGLSKIFFLEGIHRISVTKAVALESLGPLLTLILAWVFLSQLPSIWQISSLVPFIIGVFLLTGQLRFSTRK